MEEPKQKKNKRIMFLTLLPLLILGLFFISFFYYRGALKRPNYPEKLVSQNKDLNTPAQVVIESGTSTNDIAELLDATDLINSRALFKAYVFLNRDIILQAGSYQIPYNLSLIELVNTIQRGVFDQKITFLEGWRREEFADEVDRVFGKNNPTLKKDFLELTEDNEGVLFPDTYIFSANPTASEIFAKIEQNYDQKIELALQDSPRPTLNENEVLILASIIEREERVEEDKPIVAGILIKRLNEGWPLDADATVQYAVTNKKLEAGQQISDYWPKNITMSDLEIDSPYNTRKNPGLPPSPICNPGLSSIKAVLNAVETPYWFYLTGKDGVTYYAKTIEEHTANIQNYL